MMDQEVFNTLSQATFASWSLGRYTVVTSRPKNHSVSGVSLIPRREVLESLAGGALLHGLRHR